MIRRRRLSAAWKNTLKQIIRLIPLVILVRVGVVYGTGFFGPWEYLNEGGQSVDASPEFYWDLEVKRLARNFHPTENKISWGAIGTDNSEQDAATAKADSDDFAMALKEGRIKPPDPAKATERHEAARKVILTAKPDATEESAMPEEFDSEFADYHRGAIAYRRGKWEDARKAWLGLLKRPQEQRPYRTIWAAFMLGKVGLKTADPGAVKWFEWTRDLAKEGFADSLDMASASYGWEGRSEWKQQHPEKAARLFLTQLALGDESAVVSLKALIPDREPADGLLNYGPELEDREKWTDQEKQAEQERVVAGLKAAAKDPILRRLVTVHILATASGGPFYNEDSKNASVRRASRWLDILKGAKVEKIEDAEYLGWIAYGMGDYKQAARWLELGDANSPAGAWLAAKLDLRAGKLDEAAKSMQQAWQVIREPADYTGWKFNSGTDKDEYPTFLWEGKWSFPQQASGDLAKLRLSRGDFIQAMDALLKGDLWEDAAFIAERVLTADELKAYVDQMPVTSGTSSEDRKKDVTSNLRYLLGRRFVREDRYDDAAKYLPPPYDKLLQIYTKGLKDGENRKLPKIQRARAWFTAAWIARDDGMELMGTEVAPDGFVLGGNFENTDLAAQRKAGISERIEYQDSQEKTVKTPLVLKPTKEELKRLNKNGIHPDARYHYRFIAAALAIRASHLLEDNTEELADVVNTAGTWIKDRDEKLGDRYYQIIDKRCSKTKIGAVDIAKHWFVDQPGPWSNEQQTAADARDKELGINQGQP